MEDENVECILSAVSIVEVGIKSGLSKLKITEAKLKMAIQDLQLKIVPFSAQCAYGLFHLPQQTDMFDRMLAATALALNVPIIGGDREFTQYEGLKVVWQ